MLQAACCATDAGSEGAAEGGGGREAALDRAVLLCEAFAELGAAQSPQACQDDLEARLLGDYNIPAAERAAPQADAPDADADAEGGTVGALRAWLTSHREAAEQALAEAERVEAARAERATRLGSGGGGGGGGGVRLEVFPNPALSSLAAGCAALLGNGAVITIDYGADSRTLLRSARRVTVLHSLSVLRPLTVLHHLTTPLPLTTPCPLTMPPHHAEASAPSTCFTPSTPRRVSAAQPLRPSPSAGLRVRSRLAPVGREGEAVSAAQMVFTRPGWSGATPLPPSRHRATATPPPPTHPHLHP